ncbi:MAG: preprotein translocase subunit SecA [candidate division Zixibacteria bacterium]|nr:preprotein translocase subunit SecA [candidate division Zixibacteria bacterium]
MSENILTKVFGSKHERDIKKIKPIVDEINTFFEEFKSLSDEELKGKTEEFKQRIREYLDPYQTEGTPEEEQKHAQKEILDQILPEAFAVVKETCRRLLGKKWEVSGIEIEWDMVPFDVQLIGAVVLHQGKIAEMATGEGKTLVATMPIYLNALIGKGVHLVTVNDYLAKRDSQWMGEIYKFLGLAVGCIQNEMDNAERKVQYNCDITYGTNNEFGFDYLRDNMAIRAEDRVQRGFFYAIVDEVDSVLIDEARTPLIISGPVSSSTQRYDEMRPLVDQMVKRQTVLVNKLIAEGEELLKQEKEYEAGIKLLTAQRGAPKNKKLMKLLKETGVKKLITSVELDFLRDKKIGEIDDQLYYSIDERENSSNLNEMGRSLLSPQDQALFEIPDITEGIHEIDSNPDLSIQEKLQKKEELYRLHAERSEKVHNISQLLKAYSLFEKDVEYVVQDGKVLIVDEFTGRLMPGRRYSDGLHQAIEAKEGVKVEGETQTLATITLQNYFRLYQKLAGMTGTAVTEAPEFWEIYKLDVVVIPTNEPVRRIDFNDVVYRTKREKYNSIIEEIKEYHQAGHPVLVGTVSVDVSETLSRMLKREGIKHSVLNAKYHQQEAEIVAQAGKAGTVTIATNMAGRGTDIKLGPGVVKSPYCRLIKESSGEDQCPHLEELKCYENVPCGLHIMGTERHEARRIDRQLRGRSGRQGDPGSSRFYLSLEDDLMRLFGSDRIASVMDRLGVQDGEVIQHGMVTKAIERAQKRVEAQNFAIRKHLLEYDNVMNQQREVIYDRRLAALEGADLKEEVLGLIEKVVESKVEQFTGPDEYTENWNLGGLREELRRIFLLELKFKDEDIPKLTKAELKEKVTSVVREIYEHKEKAYGADIMRQLERFAMLQAIDEMWKEHLYELDMLKTGIGLRAYGQKDPLLEYKKEAFQMFAGMVDKVDEEALSLIYKLQVREKEEQARKKEPEKRLQAIHQEAAGMGYSTTNQAEEVAPGKPKPVKVGQKVGRNDPCPCGSGKKYKKCCGA